MGRRGKGEGTTGISETAMSLGTVFLTLWPKRAGCEVCRRLAEHCAASREWLDCAGIV